MRITLLLLLISISATAQTSSLAVINDPDGFTNIRRSPGAQASVAAIVLKDQPFYVEPSQSEWWKVNAVMWNMASLAGFEGFIHKSRVQFVRELPDSVQQGFFKRQLRAIRQQCKLADALREKAFDRQTNALDKTLFDSATHTRMRAYDATYESLVEDVRIYLCRTKDVLILKEWLQAEIDTEKSASEIPSIALGECYICQPDWLLEQLRSFPKARRIHFYDDIAHGLTFADDLPSAKLSKLEQQLTQERKRP